MSRVWKSIKSKISTSVLGCLRKYYWDWCLISAVSHIGVNAEISLFPPHAAVCGKALIFKRWKKGFFENVFPVVRGDTDYHGAYRAQVKQRLNKYIWVVMLTLMVQYNCPLITYYLKSLQSWCKLELTDHRSVTGSGTGQIWMSCKWEQQRTRAGCSFLAEGKVLVADVVPNGGFSGFQSWIVTKELHYVTGDTALWW